MRAHRLLVTVLASVLVLAVAPAASADDLDSDLQSVKSRID